MTVGATRQIKVVLGAIRSFSPVLSEVISPHVSQSFPNKGAKTAAEMTVIWPLPGLDPSFRALYGRLKRTFQPYKINECFWPLGRCCPRDRYWTTKTSRSLSRAAGLTEEGVALS